MAGFVRKEWLFAVKVEFEPGTECRRGKSVATERKRVAGLVEAAVVKSSEKERHARWQAKEEATKERTEKSHGLKRQCEAGSRRTSLASVGVEKTEGIVRVRVEGAR